MTLIRITFVVLALVSIVACAATQPGGAADRRNGSVAAGDNALNYVVPDRQLTAADIGEVELSLSGSDSDLKPRIDLLWYYRNQFADADAGAKANSHLLWIVTHHPDAKVLGTPIADLPMLPGDPTAQVFAKLWAEQAAKHGGSARVQGHAGLFFKSTDAERAIRLLEHAHALDKREPLWLENLGDLYASRGKAETVYGKWFDKARDAYAAALPLLKSPRSKRQLLPKLAAAQLHADKLDDAQQSADQLAKLLIKELDQSPDLAVSRHALHVVRGAIAVKRGAINEAETELAKAGDALKGQNVSLWQLDMALVDQLQSCKRSLAVITYLDKVRHATEDRAVAQWLVQLKSDKPVDFKEHLH